MPFMSLPKLTKLVEAAQAALAALRKEVRELRQYHAEHDEAEEDIRERVADTDQTVLKLRHRVRWIERRLEPPAGPPEGLHPEPVRSEPSEDVAVLSEKLARMEAAIVTLRMRLAVLEGRRDGGDDGKDGGKRAA